MQTSFGWWGHDCPCGTTQLLRSTIIFLQGLATAILPAGVLVVPQSATTAMYIVCCWKWTVCMYPYVPCLYSLATNSLTGIRHYNYLKNLVNIGLCHNSVLDTLVMIACDTILCDYIKFLCHVSGSCWSGKWIYSWNRVITNSHTMCLFGTLARAAIYLSHDIVPVHNTAWGGAYIQRRWSKNVLGDVSLCI